MRLVRFGEARTGILLDLPTGPHVLDVVASVGALSSEDPIKHWNSERHPQRRRDLGSSHSALGQCACGAGEAGSHGVQHPIPSGFGYSSVCRVGCYVEVHQGWRDRCAWNCGKR
jgi:hypothetical protein